MTRRQDAIMRVRRVPTASAAAVSIEDVPAAPPPTIAVTLARIEAKLDRLAAHLGAG